MLAFFVFRVLAGSKDPTLARFDFPPALPILRAAREENTMRIKTRVALEEAALVDIIEFEVDEVQNPAFERGRRDSVGDYPCREADLAYQVGWTFEHLKRDCLFVQAIVMHEANFEIAAERLKEALRK
jgi:hypothetical protein